MRRFFFCAYPVFKYFNRAVFNCLLSTRTDSYTYDNDLSKSYENNTREAEVVSETVHNGEVFLTDANTFSSIKKEGISFLHKEENVILELRTLQHMYSQYGPYIGSRYNNKESNEVDIRKRRSTTRIPQPDLEYRPNETSFRRLPKNSRLPNEFELRAMYPLTTNLSIIEGKADCVDHSVFGIDEDPAPIAYSMLAPQGWSSKTQHPYMVVLSDHRGLPRDFEDVCANFFERPIHRQLMLQQQWVILSPVINLRHNFQVPVEGIVARFCDWVVENFNVEHGRVHLFGKGYGAYVALRTVLDNKDVAISVTAILGRNSSPFRPFDCPQERIKNFNGVHSLVFVPGLLKKQDYYYKFKFMMDMGRVRPALRNIHFADVRDHQIYYAINPYEFWNYMRYFREYNIKMVTESGYSF